MMEKPERRAPGVKRVALERVVEICGRDQRIPAFEAESVELSGRGMHVRTPYLPALNAPLVCRLDDSGREIVVEGVVAWTRQTEGGGEFGIKFTALDSGSVDTLKALCGFRADPPAEERAVNASEQLPEDDAPEPGAPVKLHIEGLGSPMKARVRRGSRRGLHVGSNLEFLKVGRAIQVEDVQAQGTRGAQIDGVAVSIDPQTQIPQLVVTLRYEGADDVTPEPSVIDAAEEVVTTSDFDLSEPPATAAVHPVEEEPEDEDDFIDAHPMRARLEGLADDANRVAKSTGVVLARASATAATGMGHLFKAAGQRLAGLRAGRPSPPRRRTTAPAPRTVAAQPGRRLRPQSVKDAPAQQPSRAKHAAIGTAAILVLIAGGVYAFKGADVEGEGGQPQEAAEATPAAASKVLDAPPAAKAAPAEKAPAKKAPPTTKQGIVADVPLFGPTAMATMEPAPLEPPPDDIEAEAEDAIDSTVPDQSFDESEPSSKRQTVKPEDVKPWGQGRLHLPFVHRLKLDAPGIALSGEKKATGFSVFLPKRKVLESGKAIARRDDRIIDVRTKNDEAGARITFIFQGTIPPYKARLKGSYVEFFVSSPKKS